MIKILQKNSPNHYNGRGGYKPDIIVDHITGGSFTSAINTFLNKKCEVSAHFIVSKSGEIVQMVDLKDGAWCNGTTTDNSNRSYKKATSRLVKSRKTNANYYTISIEHENAGGGALTAAQLAATIELHRYIIQQVKALFGVTIPADREHIIGHCEISPINKPCCPGANFPFAKIIVGIGGAGVTENPPVPVLPNGGKIAVGSKVQITGTNYATGEKIPLWALKNSYTVSQISRAKALLQPINSWVLVGDLKIDNL